MPFASVRSPATLVALLGASFVLGLATSSGHLFLSSAGTSSVDISVRDTSPTFAGLSAWLDGPISSDRVRFREELLREVAGRTEGLQDLAFSSVDTAPVGVGPFEDPSTVPSAQLATREGFVDHITILEGSPDEPGWWIPHVVAERRGLGPGDTIEISAGSIVSGTGYVATEVRASLPVAGVYRELYAEPPADFWDPLYDYYLGTYPASDNPPPPFLLSDAATFLALEDRFAGSGRMLWELPVVPTGLTLPQAGRLAGRLEAIEAAMDDPQTQVAASFEEHDTGLPSLIVEANGTVDSLTGPVQGVAIAGRLVAVGLFVAAGVLALTRRRIELAMLSARGVGPGTLGLRGAAEAAIPAVLGAAAGWAAAGPLLRAAGPGGAVDPSASSVALVDTGVTVATGLLLLAAVTAIALRAPAERRPGRLRRIAARLPWEAAPLALAGAAFYEIRSHGSLPVQGEDGATGVDALVPLFPIAFVAALTGLALRAAVRALPRIRRASRRWRAPAYLASGRVAAAPRPAVALVAGAALAVGVVAYGAVFTSSVEATVSSKVRVSVGADAALTMPERIEIPDDLPGDITEVIRMPAARLPSGAGVAVIAVDPETFARAAEWQDGFADRPLQDLLGDLDPAGQQGEAAAGEVPPAPVIATGPLPPDTVLRFFLYEFPVRQVDLVAGFPGMRPGGALVIASIDELDRLSDEAGASLESLGASREVWVRGDHEPVLQALERASLFPTAVTTVDDVAQRPGLASVSWLFGFLQALGLLTGLLALAAVLLYVESRQRARVASYVLASRMGLSPAAHRRSLAIELLTMLALAFVLGAALAALGAYLVHADVDPLPDLPPAAVFQLPLGLIGAVGAALLGFAAIAAWVAQRRADSASAAEVMRLAG